MKYNYNDIDINIYSDEEYNIINVKNYTNKLFKDSYSFDDACDIAENVVDMFNEVPGALLKYFQNDKEFIVSKDKTTGLYGIKYVSMGVDWKKPYMLMARGLVIDEEGNIISVPYPKFFNYKQYDSEYRPDLSDEFIEYYCDYEDGEVYDVYEKLDGIMIAVTNYNGELLFSTTNKPNSKYALKAKKWLENNLTKEQINVILEETARDISVTTLLFEYVGPDNKIVVDYEKEELVLTGGITMFEPGSPRLLTHYCLSDISRRSGIRMAKIIGSSDDYSANKLIELGSKEKNIEGFVLRFRHITPKQLKIKTEDYIDKHRSSTLFFGELNTKFKNLLIIDMIRDETFDDVIADMSQRGHIATVEHMEKVYDIYSRANEILDSTYVTVRLSSRMVEDSDGTITFVPTFNKEDYFRNYKGKFGLKQTLIALLSEQKDGTYLSRNSDKIREAIDRYVLSEMKKFKEG